MDRHCRDLQVCLHDEDMTQSFGSARSGCVKDDSKPGESSSDDGEDEGQVGT